MKFKKEIHHLKELKEDAMMDEAIASANLACDHVFEKTGEYTEECKWCKIGKAWLEKNR